MARSVENVVAFYNKRGTCEQWIKEGKGAIKWTRLSRSFAANAVRLQLHALAYNLGNFLRTLATPEPIKDWTLTILKREAHQDRREGRQPRLLCRLPDGRGRHPQNSVRRYPTAGLGAAAATGGRIDVKRLLVLRPIKTKGEVCLDDNETRISGARRADVTGVGAWEPHVEDLALPKSL
jgi:hypothetical protein